MNWLAWAVVRWFVPFRHQPMGTKELAMSVWTAFMPYRDAVDAETFMRLACRIVLGDLLVAQKEWMEDHISIMHECEQNGSFEKTQDRYRRTFNSERSNGAAFNAACAQLIAEREAGTLKAVEEMNSKYLCFGQTRLEAVRQVDGTLGYLVKDKPLADSGADKT